MGVMHSVIRGAGGRFTIEIYVYEDVCDRVQQGLAQLKKVLKDADDEESTISCSALGGSR
ncbi:hypothetical protein PRIPAC_80527 [Pristionchus pacificus]|uniref:Uncharacterized protein n=1 Tax=Pristionchus pacificus TaxID=54126 RepID=A0A454Y4C3_PRIPA|nr:hypothetical protein PRIPAC_80527 [Pristionchus pacificus]|eukprot:PDM75478.1 hypothetical protein PRIPAC_42655 [Pristionchus pacificus]